MPTITMTTIAEFTPVPFTERQNLTLKLTTTIALWLRRFHTRRHLRALEVHCLADVGLAVHQRRRECAKWFWQK